ncbi:hypothetical protein SEA_JONJAMES_178 [Gordonia Phage JonJames]|nr:hypothetical protein SEA_JONJAMES_178 [Gordonia Phage JonJames]
MYELFGRPRSELLAEQDQKQAKLMSRRSVQKDRNRRENAQRADDAAVLKHARLAEAWKMAGAPIEGDLYEELLEAYHVTCQTKGELRHSEQLYGMSVERDSKLKEYL